jgi:prophage regulatory protein
MDKTTPTQATDAIAQLPPKDAERYYRERLLRVKDMQIVTSMSRSALYIRMKEKDFPKPVRLHGSALAWRESEVVAWIAALPVAA